jgi:hypothetical protein
MNRNNIVWLAFFVLVVVGVVLVRREQTNVVPDSITTTITLTTVAPANRLSAINIMPFLGSGNSGGKLPVVPHSLRPLLVCVPIQNLVNAPPVALNHWFEEYAPQQYNLVFEHQERQYSTPVITCPSGDKGFWWDGIEFGPWIW